MTKPKRSLISAVALVAATLLTGFADGPAAGPVDCRVARCVALTFDGGPGRHTGELLDVLADKNVPATFFLVGKGPVFTHPDLVRRMADAGHGIGNSSWTRPRLTEVPPEEARRQLVLTQKAVKQVTGRAPTLMRPPQGRTDGQVAALCKELGLAQILWNSQAQDRRDERGERDQRDERGERDRQDRRERRERDAKAIEEQILKSARRGSIVALHDVHEAAVSAVPGIVDGLRERGFTLVPVERLFAPAKLRPGQVYRHA